MNGLPQSWQPRPPDKLPEQYTGTLAFTACAPCRHWICSLVYMIIGAFIATLIIFALQRRMDRIYASIARSSGDLPRPQAS